MKHLLTYILIFFLSVTYGYAQNNTPRVKTIKEKVTNFQRSTIHNDSLAVDSTTNCYVTKTIKFDRTSDTLIYIDYKYHINKRVLNEKIKKKNGLLKKEIKYNYCGDISKKTIYSYDKSDSVIFYKTADYSGIFTRWFRKKTTRDKTGKVIKEKWIWGLNDIDKKKYHYDSLGNITNIITKDYDFYPFKKSTKNEVYNTVDGYLSKITTIYNNEVINVKSYNEYGKIIDDSSKNGRDRYWYNKDLKLVKSNHERYKSCSFYEYLYKYSDSSYTVTKIRLVPSKSAENCDSIIEVYKKEFLITKYDLNGKIISEIDSSKFGSIQTKYEYHENGNLSNMKIFHKDTLTYEAKYNKKGLEYYKVSHNWLYDYGSDSTTTITEYDSDYKIIRATLYADNKTRRIFTYTYNQFGYPFKKTILYFNIKNNKLESKSILEYFYTYYKN